MSVNIILRGRHYTVRSDEPEEDVRQVARWVDDQVAEVARRTPGVDGETVVLLAALNMASDYFRFRRKVATEMGSMDQDLAAIAAILEVALPGPDTDPETEGNEE